MPSGIDGIIKPEGVQTELKGAEMKVAMRTGGVERQVGLVIEHGHRGGSTPSSRQHGARQLEHVVRHRFTWLVGVASADRGLPRSGHLGGGS